MKWSVPAIGLFLLCSCGNKKVQAYLRQLDKWNGAEKIKDHGKPVQGL